MKVALDRVKSLEAQAIVSVIAPDVKEVYEKVYSDTTLADMSDGITKPMRRTRRTKK